MLGFGEKLYGNVTAVRRMERKPNILACVVHEVKPFNMVIYDPRNY